MLREPLMAQVLNGSEPLNPGPQGSSAKAKTRGGHPHMSCRFVLQSAESSGTELGEMAKIRVGTSVAACRHASA